MSWYWWTAVGVFGVYVVGFVVTLHIHMKFLQMVTPPLALIRSVAWPAYWLTGWPRGQPLPMD